MTNGNFIQPWKLCGNGGAKDKIGTSQQRIKMQTCMHFSAAVVADHPSYVYIHIHVFRAKINYVSEEVNEEVDRITYLKNKFTYRKTVMKFTCDTNEENVEREVEIIT